MPLNSVAASGAGPLGASRPTADAEIGAHLVRCFDAATAHRSDETMAALRAAAVAFASRLRIQGLPVERMVVVLKALLQGRGPLGWVPSLHSEQATQRTPEASTVYARLFGWCLDAYYGDAATTPVAGRP